MDSWINNYFYVTLWLSIILPFLCRVVLGCGFFTLPQSPPFVFDLPHFLCIAQTWKQQTTVLNGKGLFSRSLQISNEIKQTDYKQCPKSCSVCEGDRKPRAGQSNPGSKQLQNTCLSKKIRRKRKQEILSFRFLVVFFSFWELGSSARTENYLVFSGLPLLDHIWLVTSSLNSI